MRMGPTCRIWLVTALTIEVGLSAPGTKGKPAAPMPEKASGRITEGVANTIAAPDPADAKGPTRPALASRNPRYRVRKSDVLEVNFPFTPEFNQTVTVQPDGYLTMRPVGDIHVEGLTKQEIVEALKISYADVLRDPVITIELKDFERPFFIAGGELSHPGKYELRSDTTVVQAVAIAGGFSPRSKHSQVLVFRRVSSDLVEVKQLNVKKMLAEHRLNEDLFLRPGDMIFVPQNAISKIGRFIPSANMGMYMSPTGF